MEKRMRCLGMGMLLGVGLGLAPSTPAALDLKIMTFNIRNGGDRPDWDKRKAQVFDLFKTKAPDLAGLQEAFRYQLDEMKAANPEYGELGVGRDDGKTAGEYSALLYRKSAFTVDTSGTYWLSSTPDVPGSKFPGAGSIRINTWARLRHTATGKYFYFNSSHWDNVSDPARKLAGQVIADRIAKRAHKEDPVIAVCDCNTGDTDPAVRYLLGEGGSPLKFYSVYSKLYPSDMNSATFHDFKGVTAGRPIDHILTFDSVQALDATIIRDHIGTVYPSDHYPLMATLRINVPVTALEGRPAAGKPGAGKHRAGNSGDGAHFRAMKSGRVYLLPDGVGGRGVLGWDVTGILIDPVVE